MKRFAILAAAALGLSGCVQAVPPTDVSLGDLPPIVPDYRASIVTWSKTYYAEPASLRGVSASDPTLTRDNKGRLLWLVCFEADARGTDRRYLGAERQAFGFAPNYVSAPLDRRGSSLSREDCDIRPLVWRPWPTFPALARMSERHPSRRR